jgi:hypothetical protein
LFSGIVASVDSKPIRAATVEVNGSIVTTDDDGRFGLLARRSGRYVLNIRKPGFALVSQIYQSGVRDKTWVMDGATTVFADPRQAISVRDSPRCRGTLSGKVDWSQYPMQRAPRMLDGDGRMVVGEYAPELRDVMKIIEAGPPCSEGVSVSIPANALIDARGRPPEGDVQVAVSTVDLFAPDSMPGDFTALVDGKRRVFMRSAGAGTVQVTADGRSYQLKDGMEATLTIPVDPGQLKLGQRPEPTIPLLVYDEKDGFWVPRGTATLDPEANAYVATVDHFSAFNMDQLKTNPSCLKFTTEGIEGAFQLEVTMLDEPGNVTITHDIRPEHGVRHALYNLPNDADIVMRAFKDGRPLGTYLANSGPSYGGDGPPVAPYDECNGSPIWPMKEIILEQCEGVASYEACLRWTKVPNLGGDGKYEVNFTVNGFGSSASPLYVTALQAGCSSSAATSCTHTHTPAQDGTYRYRIEAPLSPTTSPDESRAISNEVTIAHFPPPPEPPSPPSGVQAVATSSRSVDLSWIDTASNESGYRVRRGTAATGPFSPIGAESLPANIGGFRDQGTSGPASNTTYFYSIQAWNSAGESGMALSPGAKT